MKNWAERVRKCSWGQLLFLASTSGLISGLAFAVSGVYGCDAIEMQLTHGNVTELGSAVLAIYAFLGFGATGFIAAFSSVYAIARRQTFFPLIITFIVFCINLLGWFVPTGGYALLPFYASLAIGVGLTISLSFTRKQQQLAE
jgi:hypothetical protein